MKQKGKFALSLIPGKPGVFELNRDQHACLSAYDIDYIILNEEIINQAAELLKHFYLIK